MKENGKLLKDEEHHAPDGNDHGGHDTRPHTLDTLAFRTSRLARVDGLRCCPGTLGFGGRMASVTASLRPERAVGGGGGGAGPVDGSWAADHGRRGRSRITRGIGGGVDGGVSRGTVGLRPAGLADGGLRGDRGGPLEGGSCLDGEGGVLEDCLRFLGGLGLFGGVGHWVLGLGCCLRDDCYCHGGAGGTVRTGLGELGFGAGGRGAVVKGKEGRRRKRTLGLRARAR